MQNLQSVFDVLRHIPHWLSSLVCSVYGNNLDIRMLGNILCLVEKSDIKK
jgi:hypothetical protein